jgi:hypothetical protein
MPPEIALPERGARALKRIIQSEALRQRQVDLDCLHGSNVLQ